MKKILSLCIVLVTITTIGINSNEQVKKETPIIYDKLVYEGFSLSTNSSTEDISEEVTKDYHNTVNVQLQFDYIVNNYEKDSVTEDSVDDFIKESREESRRIHIENNNLLLEELGLTGYEDIYVSTYSPFIDLQYTDESFIENLDSVLSLVDNDSLAHIYIQSTEEIEENNFTTALSAGNVDSVMNKYMGKGNGINVGVLEAGGIIDKSHPNIAGSNFKIRKEWYYIETVSDHATQVASIIGGNNGIAPASNILSVELSGGASSEVDWLLDNDVNIINMSYGDSTPTGQYSSKSAYMDYISVNQWVTFVGSSGNEGRETGYVLNPGLGYNVVSVGATSSTGKTIADYSSYKVAKGSHKPNLVAPSGFKIPNYDSNSYGTSFSAPYVSGCIALLMEEYSMLKLYPEAVNSILSSSATTMSNYSDKFSSGLNDKVGAGLIDLLTAFEVKNTTYNFTNNNTSSGVVRTRQVYLEEGQTIKSSLYWMLNSTNSTSNSLTDYDLRLYGPSGNSSLISAYSTQSNLEVIEYKVKESGYYTLSVYQYGDRGTGSKDWMSLSYNIF